ncbi:MAG: UDP-2,4-diacetamido-2,4,6-trideoxy-beta-L-altropyranose hydrolase [candidate division Zixibacteria bacterium]|nr:UDP-2,4-diacetamido-2,4,6-trideoxy-beta-L-altropyranose hydrolase [candidate division Zixibacteria bacterium]
MRIAIRVDSSTTIGTGHLMRCLTLADYLRDKGADVDFISRELPGNMCSYIEEQKYRLHRLPFDKELLQNEYMDEYARWLMVGQDTDADQVLSILLENIGAIDWLIVDHYGLDYRWERQLRAYVSRIMVIDDLANRKHDCDLLLDQNLYENLESRYNNLVSSYCNKLLGLKYALLRPEFIKARNNVQRRNGNINRILIFFGGSDITNETAKALKAIKSLGLSQTAVDVVIGNSNPHRNNIESIIKDMANTGVHCQVKNMAQLMAKADLAIGGGGTTTWERCYLGLPTITILIAENQKAMIRAAGRQGSLWNMDWHSEVTVEMLAEKIKWVLGHPDDVLTVSENALRLMPQHDHSLENNVVSAMLEECHARY